MKNAVFKSVCSLVVFTYCLTLFPLNAVLAEEIVAAPASPPAEAVSLVAPTTEAPATASEGAVPAPDPSTTTDQPIAEPPTENSGEDSSKPEAENAPTASPAGNNPYYPPQQNFKFNSLENLQPQLFTGAATYSVPIEVPPGRGGIQPNISLNYSSQSGNGIAGMGWSLSLSSIERSTKKGLPNYENDSQDTFVLNSSLSSGELSGIGNNQYRSKIEESFTKIEFISLNNSWLATDKMGTKYYFGQSSDSQIEDGITRVFAWYLDKIVDLNGNYLTIVYEHNQKQIYPKIFSYTGNKLTGDMPQYAVNFIFEDRSDIRSDYRSGIKVVTAKRLKEIDVEYNQARVRSYKIAYEPITGNSQQSSLLKTINLFGKDDSEVLPPMEFEYKKFDNRFEEKNEWHGLSDWTFTEDANYQKQQQVSAIRLTTVDGITHLDTIDMNGDGLPDRVYLENPNGVLDEGGNRYPSEKWYVQLNNGNGFNPAILWLGVGSRYGDSNDKVWYSIKYVDNGITKVDIMDINGDGLPDRVMMGNYNLSDPEQSLEVWRVQLNNGKGFDSVVNWPGAYSTAPADDSSWFSIRSGLASGDTIVDLVDINGDGLPDRVMAANSNREINPNYSNYDTWRVQLNKGDRFGPLIAWPNVHSIDLDDNPYSRMVIRSTDPVSGATSVDLIDINGDGLPDRVMSSGSSWHVQLNRGDSFAVPIEWPGLHSWTFAEDAAQKQQRVNAIRLIITTGTTHLDIIDMNGDGLPDRVWQENPDGVFNGGQNQYPSKKWYVQLNTGSSFASAIEWTGLHNWTFTDDWTYQKQQQVNAIRLTTSNGTTYIDTIDMNGDGLPDRVWQENPNGVLNEGGKRYPSKTWYVQLNTNTEPLLLKKVSNGIGGTMTINYKPYKGKDNSNYDPKKPLPFPVWVVENITQDSGFHPPITTNYSYDSGYFDFPNRELRGFGKGKVIDPDGNYTETYFKQDDLYKGKSYLEQSKDKNGNLYSKAENSWDKKNLYTGVDFVFLKQTDNYLYDGDSTYKQTQTKYEYDSYGNNTAIRSMGEPNKTGDEKIIFTGYIYNPNVWLVACQRHSFLYYNGVKSAMTWFYHDANGSVDGTPTKCQTTKQKDLVINPLTGLETTIITKYLYDAYGNQTTVIDPLGNATTTTYDDQLHTYPVKVVNPLGHTVASTYDYALGQVLTTTDPNNQTTKNIYDGFGRLIKVIGPLDNDSQPASIYEYDLSAKPIKVITKVKPDYTVYPENYLVSYAFFDGLGRNIQNRIPAEDNPQTGERRQIISGAVAYDSRGLLQKKHFPYYELYSENYSAPDDSQPFAEFSYDSVGRLIKTTNPDGNFSTVAYNDWVTTTTDENNHSQTNYADAYGRLVKVEEFNQGQKYTTNYQYDAQDNLTKITDNQGNVSQYWFDSLNRNLKMSDPDLGTWAYEYDRNGNLTKQTDAKNQILYFSYDKLNRITNKRANSLDLANYFYDDTRKPFGIGRPFGEKYYDEKGALIGYNRHFYDALGRETATVNEVFGVGYYTTNRTYDALNRINTITYPDRQTIMKYNYNPQGVEQVRQGTTYYISRVDYTATNQITKINYGTGVTTLYTYNPQTLRLSNILTKNNVSGAKLQDLTYTFDKVGNIETITDAINANNHTFTYDDLDRLIGDVSPTYSHTYAYDSIGNITNKIGATMTYGKNGKLPHAPVTYTDTKGTTTFDYDANGNLFKKGNAQVYQQFTYNADNHLVKVENRSGTNIIQATDFTYDNNGQRVKKIIGGNSTTYLGNLYEIDSDGAIRKHLFAGANHFLTISSKASVNTYGYYHPDHLGSSNVITDQTGVQVSLTEFAPYGATRKQTGTYDPEFKFTGKELDATTGLYYYGARYYDTTTGRFTQADTIAPNQGDPQSLNRYAYTLNNPLKYVDPTGKTLKEFIYYFFWSFGKAEIEAVTNPVDTVIRVAMGFYDLAQTAAEAAFDVSPAGRLIETTTGYSPFKERVSGYIQAGEDYYSEFSQMSDVERGLSVGFAAERFTEGLVAAKGLGKLGGKLTGAGQKSESILNQTIKSVGKNTSTKTYRHYGNAKNTEKFSGGLKPGSYGTTAIGRPMNGSTAFKRLGLEHHKTPPDCYYNVKIDPTNTPVVGPRPVPGVKNPGIEYFFPKGTPLGSVTGPFLIKK